ncbi:MAG TPA: phosphoribosylformylglycinamidine cyclo-ligase [Thermomicrobiales bacterium]|nr:phosphoribosylformylglycinamidine cyclo-ligase [Thermomicrobiales bacterium]
MGSERKDAVPAGLTYRDAGVDIDAATNALERIKRHARSTVGEAGAPIGHFGGIYRLPGGGDRLLVASADGIGTKLKLAFVLGGAAHARVGADLVNHCVNDLLACGAHPLFFLDYVAMGALDGETLERLVSGMAAACRENGLALIGGETAEMPGLYQPGEYDAAGFIVGEVAPDRLIDGRAVAAGDVLIGLRSGGLQTNGFSLARRILGLTGDSNHDLPILRQLLPGEPTVTIGEALMRPHTSFLPVVMPLVEQGIIHGMAHITGGGLIDNVPRMLPDGLSARIDDRSWTPDPIFPFLLQAGMVPRSEWHRAFNMGIGFVLAISEKDMVRALEQLPGAFVLGAVVPATGESSRVVWESGEG